MNLTELKEKPINELVEMAEAMGIENVARSRKQDVIFALLKRHAKSGEEISGDGVLEILSDGFGFLRSSDSSYLAGPDDIYVSPSQIRRFNLRTGDTISGKIRPPKDGERYFALLKVSDVNFVGLRHLAHQGAVREPHRAVPAGAPEARAGQRQQPGPLGPDHGSVSHRSAKASAA